MSRLIESASRSWRTALAVIVGGLFVFAGTMKLGDPVAFLKEIRGFRMLPYPAAWTAVFLFPWLEILAGIGLMLPFSARSARRVLLAMLAVFIGAVILAWCRGLDVRCGCFGAVSPDAGPPNYVWWVIRNCLLGLAVIVSRPFKLAHDVRQNA